MDANWYIDKGYYDSLYTAYHLNCERGFIKSDHPTLSKIKTWSFRGATVCACGITIPYAIKIQLKLLNEK